MLVQYEFIIIKCGIRKQKYEYSGHCCINTFDNENTNIFGDEYFLFNITFLNIFEGFLFEHAKQHVGIQKYYCYSIIVYHKYYCIKHEVS